MLVVVHRAFVGYSSRLHRAGRRGRPSWSGSATRSGWSAKPGLHFKAPFIDSVVYVDKRILDLENPSDRKSSPPTRSGLVVDAFARYRIVDPLRFYQAIGTVPAANSQLSTLLNSALRRVLGESSFQDVVRDDRDKLMKSIPRAARPRSPALRHRTWSTSAFAAPICRSRTARRCISACRPNVSVRRRSSALRARSAGRKSARAPTAT